MFGFFFNLWVKIEFIGYAIVEAFIFYLAFNFFAPFFSENIFTLPVVKLSYLICLSLFVMIHYIGTFIGKLTPKLVSISTETKTEEKK